MKVGATMDNKLLKELTLDFSYIFGAINQGKVFDNETNMKEFLLKSKEFQKKLVDLTEQVASTFLDIEYKREKALLTSHIQSENEITLKKLSAFMAEIDKQVYLKRTFKL